VIPYVYTDGMMVPPDRESDVFGAMSHPARRRMRELLVEADRYVDTIAGQFQMSRLAVSRRLRILLDVSCRSSAWQSGPLSTVSHGR
jgi:predicted transcriptional regulator